MNWNKIKEKYPKAYQLGQDWWVEKCDFYDVELLAQPKSNRFLYDFFDEQGISVTIDWNHSDNPTIKVEWYYEISDFEMPAKILQITDRFHSRTEAEENAFEKAFEILEDKLK